MMNEKQLQIKVLKRQLAVLTYQVSEARLAHMQECQVTDALNELIEEMAEWIREFESTIEKQRNEIETLKRRIDLYETNGQKCNRGHRNVLPVSLWDCPMCTDELRHENEALKAIIAETNRLCWKPSAPARAEWLRTIRNQRRLGQ